MTSFASSARGQGLMTVVPDCIRQDRQYDTNPTWECKFATYHWVKNAGGAYVLDPHWHYTAAATSGMRTNPC